MRRSARRCSCIALAAPLPSESCLPPARRCCRASSSRPASYSDRLRGEMTITDLPAEIAVGDLDDWRRAGRDIVVLDVREDWEVALCALADSLKIPMQQIPARKAELPQDKPLVVMCHHGGRSRQVMQWLRANGFPQAINLAGGIHAWAEQIDPGMARY